MDNVIFARNLVKGKIAETIFAQMLRETKEFTVLEFGYEKIIPELVQQGYHDDNPMIETLRTAPDFAVINKRTRGGNATLDGFYFDEIDKIIKNNGKIKPLKHPQLQEELQIKYLQILKDFERNN